MERTAKVVFLLCSLVSVAAVLLICTFLFLNGIPAIGEIGLFDFLLGGKWQPTNELFGILPMIVGSVYVTLGALVIGVPIGLLTAMYLARFAKGMRVKVLNPAVNLLAGIPSVVYGFFGLVILVPFVRDTFGGDGFSLLTVSVLLGMMILPTIITVSQTALRAVPQQYYEGALALGATHERTCFKVILPAAKSGITAAIILGVGRAIGETMAVVMIAGNQARIPNSLLKGLRTLTSNIVLEMGYAADLHREALIATAVVLFVFILIINLTCSYIKRRNRL